MLSRLRREKGLSQRKAAADLGVSQALLSHYENDAREPKLDFVVRACNYYSVSADFLLGRTDERISQTLSIPQECDGASKLSSTTGAVFDMLGELSDPELYAAAVDFLAVPVETVATLLRNPDERYDPSRDADLKMAEALLLRNARRVAQGPEDQEPGDGKHEPGDKDTREQGSGV